MILCTLIYMVVAACALGCLSPYDVFSKERRALWPSCCASSAIAGRPASLIAGAGGGVALPTVIMVFMFGQSPVFFAMDRDSLLPTLLATDSKRGVPATVTILTGLIAAAVAGHHAAVGDRRRWPTPAPSALFIRHGRHGGDGAAPPRAGAGQALLDAAAVWLIGPAAVLGCLYLFSPACRRRRSIFFFIWNAAGVVVYPGCTGAAGSRLKAIDRAPVGP